MAATLEAKKRHDLKYSTTREFRLNGQVPAILYGKKIESQPVAVDSVEFLKTLRDNGRNAIISLSVENDGEKHEVIVHDFQKDKIKGEILHIDFFEVDMQSEMDAEVPVRMVGEAKGTQIGGVASQLLHTITVRCLPKEIPDEIQVDISNLDVGDSVQIRDIVDSSNFQIANDLEETIVTVLMSAAEKEPEQDPEAKADEAQEDQEEKQED